VTLDKRRDVSSRTACISMPTSRQLCFPVSEVRSTCYEHRSSHWREDAGETPAVRRSSNLADVAVEADVMSFGAHHASMRVQDPFCSGRRPTVPLC